jgi:two-component system sensor histidine kinase YesM
LVVCTSGGLTPPDCGPAFARKYGRGTTMRKHAVSAPKRFFSIQRKVLLFTLLIVILPILILGLTSYLKSSELIQQKVSISNLNTVGQIGSNIEFILKDTYDLSLFFIQDPGIRGLLLAKGSETEDEIEKKKIVANSTLAYFLGAKPYIHSINVVGFNNFTISTSSGIDFNPTDSEQLFKLKGKRTWNIQSVLNKDKSAVTVFSLDRVINDINNVNNKLGILRINISADAISDIYRNKNLTKNGYFLIVDGNNRIIAALDDAKIGQTMDAELLRDSTQQSKQGYYTKAIDGGTSLVTYYGIGDTDWRLMNVVPMTEILKGNAVIPTVMIVSIIVSLVVCAGVAVLFSMKVLGPLKKMRSLMRKIEHEDFNVTIDIKSNDEMGLLARSFNRMSERLNELVNQVYTFQLKQKETELKALQAQINPHFLYNTLDTIYWNARMEKALETSDLVEALSNLFRRSLSGDSEKMSVRDEVEHLKNYITIQQKRYEGIIQFHIHAEEEAMDCRTIKFILQPLVENAIYHGIDKKGDKGNIYIMIFRENGSLIFVVMDDGCGVDLEEIQQLLDKPRENNRGLGIKNVNDRIKLLHGDGYGIEFQHNRPAGTVVKVSQPLEGREEQHDQADDH